MPRVKPAKSAPSRVTGSRELSTDDVIRQILNLFDLLGLDAEQLAARVTGLKRSKKSSRPLFYHEAAIGEVLTSWHQNPRYLDSAGIPLPIRMSGKEPSFLRLAESSVPGVEPKKLLKELKQVGAVSVDRDKRVRVEMRFLSVYLNRKFAVQYTLASLDSFVKTLAHNLLSEPSNAEQLFHRVARNASIDIRDLPALKVRIKRQGQRFLESCDNWLTYRAKSRRKSTGKCSQVSVGLYLAVDNPAALRTHVARR